MYIVYSIYIHIQESTFIKCACVCERVFVRARAPACAYKQLSAYMRNLRFLLCLSYFLLFYYDKIEYLEFFNVFLTDRASELV